MEEKHPKIQAHDMLYGTKLSEYKALTSSVKDQAYNECKPAQHLLFSESKLGMNYLRNQFDKINWDMILIDGPYSHWPTTPYQMRIIFIVRVLASSKKAPARSAKTVFLWHDYNLDPQNVSSGEFLCKENLMENNRMLAPFFLEDGWEELSLLQQKRYSKLKWYHEYIEIIFCNFIMHMKWID